MIDIASIIQALCDMPVTFSRGNMSKLDLLKASGYLSNPDAITEELLEEYLRKHPDLINRWVGLSEDQRCSPAWVFLPPDRGINKDKKWLVYYAGQLPDMDQLKARALFVDKFKACAFFVKRHAEQLGNQLY